MVQLVPLLRGFQMEQDSRFFKLTQDTVFLASFVRLEAGQRALDLGAGVGALSLLLLIRNPGTTVDGVELVPEAAALAARNYTQCGFHNRGQMTSGDYRALPPVQMGSYDHCVSNPPYYDARRGKSSPSAARRHARSDACATPLDLCQAAARALRPRGSFSLCYPPNRLAELFCALECAKLTPRRLRLVHVQPNRPAYLALVEAAKGVQPGLSCEPPLFVQNEAGAFTDEYHRIYEQ